MRGPGREAPVPLDEPNPPGCICEYNHPSCSYCPASAGRETTPAERCPWTLTDIYGVPWVCTLPPHNPGPGSLHNPVPQPDVGRETTAGCTGNCWPHAPLDEVCDHCARGRKTPPLLPWLRSVAGRAGRHVRPRGVFRPAEQVPQALADLPPWVGTLLAAAIDQADETDCNRDHEGEDGCDACAWDDVLRPVPNRLVAEVYRKKEAHRG